MAKTVKNKKMAALFSIMISIVFVFSVFSGCKKEPSLAEKMKTGAAGAQKIESAQQPTAQGAAEAKEEVYVYDPKGRVDPFVPLVETTKKEKDKKAIAGTLESYDVTDFKLIAIAEKENKRYGLLLARDNKSYTVREGSVLGLHKGIVKEITPNKIVIFEYTKDYKGELKPRQVVLELFKGEGE